VAIFSSYICHAYKAEAIPGAERKWWSKTSAVGCYGVAWASSPSL
jgi:hypothetical protein